MKENCGNLSPCGCWFRNPFQCVVPTWADGLVDERGIWVALVRGSTRIWIGRSALTGAVGYNCPNRNDPMVCLASVRGIRSLVCCVILAL